MPQTPLKFSNLVSVKLIAMPFVGNQIEFIGDQIELKAVIRFRKYIVHLSEEAYIEIGLKRGLLMVTTSQYKQAGIKTPVAVIDNVTTSEAIESHKKLFEAKQELILSETKEISIGRIAKPCRVAATFEIRGMADLYPTKIGGLWPNNIRGNKLSLMKKEALFHFIEPRLESRLVEVEEFYG